METRIVRPTQLAYPMRVNNAYLNRKAIRPTLYCKGNMSLLGQDSVLVIGSRKCSELAQATARYIGAEFAKRGFPIVSGLALGCDTAAHQGALEVNGKTIAVLAHGLSDDVMYPKENLSLAKEILAKGGLLVSMYPDHVRPTKQSFVERDILQARLAFSTIVIASTETGGTMYAAKETVYNRNQLYTIAYTDEQYQNSEEVSGNRLLVKKYGAKNIVGMRKAEMKIQLDTIAEEMGPRMYGKNAFRCTAD